VRSPPFLLCGPRGHGTRQAQSGTPAPARGSRFAGAPEGAARSAHLVPPRLPASSTTVWPAAARAWGNNQARRLWTARMAPPPFSMSQTANATRDLEELPVDGNAIDRHGVEGAHSVVEQQRRLPGAGCHTRLSEENQVQTYMHARIKFHAYSDIKVYTETLSRKKKKDYQRFTLNPGNEGSKLHRQSTGGCVRLALATSS
jgi:hypothetical protein